LDKDRERVEGLEEAVVGAVWEETVRAQDPEVVAFARIAAREPLINGEYHAIQ